MGARALDDLAVGVDQRIGLARERRDLDRETPLQALGRAGADRREAGRDALERCKAEPHLEHGGDQQHDREHAERHRDGAIEALRLVVDLERVARDRDQIAAVVAEIDRALDQPQPLIFRSRHVALARSVRGGLHVHVFEMRQAGVPQRARRAHLGLRRRQLGDLPVPAGQRQLEQRLAERLRDLLALLRRRHVGDQRAEIDAEPAVERALDAVAVERGQHDAGDEQDDDRHRGGGNEQAQRERISPHGPSRVRRRQQIA